VLALLTDPALRARETARVSVLLKPFMVVPKLVDLLIEPAVHELGGDLYAEDWHLRITEVLASLGEDACPVTWRPMLDAFVVASRRPRPDAALRLGERVAAAVQEGNGHPVGEFLLMALAPPDVLLDRLTTGPSHQSSDALDPALTAAYEQVAWWGERLGPLRLVHDESKLIGRWRDRLLALADPAVVESHRLTASVVPDPLPLAALHTAASHDTPAIQVADVVAGAAADILRAAARAEELDEWRLRLREARVLRFLDHLVWWAPGTRLREELEAQGLLDDDA